MTWRTGATTYGPLPTLTSSWDACGIFSQIVGPTNLLTLMIKDSIYFYQWLKKNTTTNFALKDEFFFCPIFNPKYLPVFLPLKMDLHIKKKK